jgi:hypothetical protein
VQLLSQMFTQVLGIMTSLLITSQSKERKALCSPSSQAILASQQPFTMSQVRSYHQAKTFLTEDANLPELSSDN